MTSSMFGMLATVKSRYWGSGASMYAEPLKLLISAKREELGFWKLF